MFRFSDALHKRDEKAGSTYPYLLLDDRVVVLAAVLAVTLTSLKVGLGCSEDG